MPRPSRATPSPITALVDAFVADIERVVRAEFEARLTSLFDQFARSGVPAVAAPPLKPAPRTPSGRLCTTPDCTSPAAGPKYGWKCREHGAAYRGARSKVLPLAVARATTPAKAPAPIIALPAPKTATVIPADFKITRLPPGPVPRESKRTGPSMECRCPGCPTKSRGPRYDFFCADHYARFNAEERRKYSEMWKAGRRPSVS